MDINKDLALKMWDDIFGPNKETAIDCYGAYIKRNDYGDHETLRLADDGKKYSYGWDLDHIRPKANFSDPSDADFLNNLEPVHWQNNQEKSDGFPHFTVDGKKYTVVKCDICGAHQEKGYGVVDENQKRIDWKGVSRRYYSSNKNS